MAAWSDTSFTTGRAENSVCMRGGRFLGSRGVHVSSREALRADAGLAEILIILGMIRVGKGLKT